VPRPAPGADPPGSPDTTSDLHGRWAQTPNVTHLRSHTYEITFIGRAGDTLRAAFDDCTVTEGPGTTTLSADLPDQAALWGLVLRIIGLGLEVVDLHLVAPKS
jgi:hypothetical protein